MKFAKSIVTGTGAVVLAGLILALLAPKAAHAIVATAVQVTNTSANPAITQSTRSQAAQLVQLDTISKPGLAAVFSNVGPAQNGSVYFVPAGQSLVVTAVDITPSLGCTTASTFALSGNNNNQPSTNMLWTLSAPTTGHFEYPSGIVFGSGAEPLILFASSLSTTNSCFANGATVNLLGYLTSN
jgi:hypothetical protein